MSPNVENLNTTENILKYEDSLNQSINHCTIDYIYYAEWRQFAVPNDTNLKSGRLPATAMEMLHSRALIGEFHEVLNELRTYHNRVTAAPVIKSKKRVRFQPDEKLYTCIPDVLQGCHISKIDKVVPSALNNKCIASHELFKKLSEQLRAEKYTTQSDKKDEESLDSEKTEQMLTLPSRNCILIRVLKKAMNTDNLQKLFRRRSRRVAAAEAIIPTSQKKMERSSSYCRHDDADNMFMYDDVEFQEIDEDTECEKCDDDNINPLSQYAYV